MLILHRWNSKIELNFYKVEKTSEMFKVYNTSYIVKKL
ncbi:hypothetical protein SAMN05421545_2705 [Pontibacter lucknowensis]|uniref:Uncharacterized protein n=1 Tax=Pontibacter lucknowensis TaxID=1077936 RepID=A0A1N6Z2Q9_9BACT|nr:hypothetical protein SAMN05421545_2705 [Pontibacter lucknowensis]